MKPRAKKYTKIIVKLFFSSLLLYIVLKKIDLPALQQLLASSNPYLLILASVFFIASKVISAFRLNIFFHAVNISLTAMNNLRLYWLGMFYNLFLPGGIGGDGYKAWYLKRHIQAPVKQSVLAMVIDRVTGLFALVVLAFIFMLLSGQDLLPGIVPTAAILISIPLFYFVIYKWFRRFYFTLHLTNLQSVAVQLAQVISAWLILLALGAGSNMAAYLLVFLVSSVVAVIPFTIGGIGARELTFLYASQLLGLDTPTSVALSLVFFLITAMVSMGGAWYLFQPEKIRLEPLNRLK